MVETDPGALSMKLLKSGILRWIIFLLIIVLFVVIVVATQSGGFQIAAQLSGVVSAMAAILLVSLTAEYAQLTQDLVKETENAREQRKKERQTERSRELNALRRALREEVGKVAYFDELAENYEVHYSSEQFPAPSTVYENNAGKIGLLTVEEIDNIIEYYARMDRVLELMDLQRKFDTTTDMGFLEEFLRRMEAIVEMLIRKISFGKVGSHYSQERKQRIRKELSGLHDAQQRAQAAIERNLEDGR